MSIQLPKLIALTLVLAILGVITTQTVLAKNDKGDTRPGWGNGDKNHVHTGPPGQSNHP